MAQKYFITVVTKASLFVFVFLGSFGATSKIVSQKEASQDLLQPKQLPQRWTRVPGFRKKRNPI